MQPLRRYSPQPTHLPLRRRQIEVAATHSARALPRLPAGLARWSLTGFLALLAALSLAQWPGRTVALDRLDLMAVKLGLGVTQIAVTGLDRALTGDVFAAVEAAPGRSILAFDAEAARARLEALPWIKSATITRALPGEVTVRVSEREPFAVWQNRQMPFLIDAEGRTLEPVAPSDYPELPIVAGAGAAEEAGKILALIGRYPKLRARVGAAVRVAGRRWTLKLRSGPDVLLSADDPEASLARLDVLQSAHKLLDRRLATIDLRHPAQIVVTPLAASG